ncbi:MAG: ATP synthase F1 subunit gamma [Cytophagaceae bacterium]|nr:ATP synthase F1 subunit gamma [Cytophagaceae bacterium]
MANLKEVRNRIVSVNSTQQITKAMKMVAAAKLRRAQDNITRIRPYAEKLDAILSNLSASLEDASDNIYASEREIKRVLIVAITSDRGLAGAFNANVLKGINNFIHANYTPAFAMGNVEYMALGKKGFEALQRRKDVTALNGDHAFVFGNLTFDAARPAVEWIMDRYVTGYYDKVVVVYNEFKNVATQVVRTEQFLPIVAPATSVTSTTSTDYIFEPSKEEIVEELIPKSLKIKFYKFLLDSYASENGARMTAMEKATENAKDLLKELKLVYNRSRQAAITKEILEIVGGAEALNG